MFLVNMQNLVGCQVMSKMLSKRYLSEAAVKKALKIDSFRNLSKDKVMQFASMIPYMDKDVAMAIINQFPEFVEFGKMAISSYMQLCDTILEKNNECQVAVIKGYQTILDALSRKMEADDLSEESRKAITEDMIAVADKIAQADLQNKKFLDRMVSKGAWFILGIAAMIGAGIGINAVIGRGDDIPQLADDENDDNYEIMT